MPPQPSAQTRFNNIVTSLRAALSTFNVITESMQAPFLEPISNTLHSLLTSVQTVKQNQDDCTQMLEQINELLYAVISIHIKSNTGGELSPIMLDNLGRLTETLHKIHTFVEAKQEKSKIKQFFRQGEMRTLLKACHAGLDEALEVFKIHGATVLKDVADLREHSQKAHQEVLELISALSDGETSERGSSISRVLSTSHNSSNSFSLLPSQPKIFHGRDLEVSAIIQQLNQLIPRVAILGGGGMGKTSLARAVLHHPNITARYDGHCVFVACDAASTSIQLAALIGAHVGLKPGPDMTELVVWYFSDGPPSLLILDNLETVWEPRESRADVEKFLALLEAIDHLALIVSQEPTFVICALRPLQITMRGAERPANVRWTHPFLEPLKPLPQDAARRTFTDIVDTGYTIEDIDKILLLADNMPLAIDLIAHLVDYDGLDSVMHHWETERTLLLSEGHNKGSNLELSISLSLESPRLASVPHARNLLSLLAILPDGLSNADLLQSHLPIENILASKAALLRTSLAYTDDQNRLKALVPIREYMQKIHPAMAQLIQPLLKHFNKLIENYGTYFGTVSNPGSAARIESNFANIQSILAKGLRKDNTALVRTIQCTLQFQQFMSQTGRGQCQLLHQIPDVLPEPRDHRLEVEFIHMLFASHRQTPVPNAKHAIDQALEYFPYFDDPDLKCRFYHCVAEYLWFSGNGPEAIYWAQNALSLSIATGSTLRQSIILATWAWIMWGTGDYTAGRERAYGHILNTQAEVHLLKSEYVEARRIHAQILHAAPIKQNPYDQALYLLTTAQIDVEINASRDGVQRNIDMAKQLFSSVGYSVGFILCDATTAPLEMNDGDLLKATSLFQACIKSAWGTNTEIVSYCLERLGNSSLWLGASSNWTVIFLVHSLMLKQKLEIHKALQFLGDLYLAEGDQQTATSLLTVALEGFTRMDVHRSIAECMLRLGDISELQGDLAQAAGLWKTARPLFEQSSQAKQITHIDIRLARASSQSEHHIEPFVQLSVPYAQMTPPESIDDGVEDIMPASIPV
ncbi:hypothetical protein FB451DRAFT_1176285 [Mycena latifolia]|nr:hypothetical protein FB451DRAFT_1176285 [Mycena latifolia]